MFINKVFLYGNLTRDPELKKLPSGTDVCNFSLATNRTWRGKDGQKQESAEFHNLVAFGKTAELIKQYMTKGNGLYVEGRLQTRSWEAKDGSKRQTTEIVVDSMQFGHKRSKTDETDTVQAEPEVPTVQIDESDLPF